MTNIFKDSRRDILLTLLTNQLAKKLKLMYQLFFLAWLLVFKEIWLNLTVRLNQN